MERTVTGGSRGVRQTEQINVIFDIDGTLLRSVDVDDRCFRAAFQSVAGIELGTLDWSNFKHSTDAGLTPEIFERSLGRPPDPEEIQAIRADFFDRLERAISLLHPEQFATPGASTFLEMLDGLAHYRVAIATGGWRTSAAMKLRYAGLFNDAIPLHTSDDAVIRADILNLALSPAEPSAPAIYVGDKPWDLIAARKLGIGFLGVGSGKPAIQLRQAGATEVQSDFRDADTILNLIKRLAQQPK